MGLGKAASDAIELGKTSKSKTNGRGKKQVYAHMERI